MATIAKISSQGQITIPARLRQIIGVEPNERVLIHQKNDSIVVSKLPEHDKLVEKWTSSIKPGIEPLTDVDGFYQTRKPRV
jgi:AbrB family looped-hinge helix DNA binding protein